MKPVVRFKKLNETFARIECESSIKYELRNHFSFFVPGYKFMPKFRNRIWDGKIYLFNNQNSTIYTGLEEKIKEFCVANDYVFETDTPSVSNPFSVYDAKQFLATVPLDSKFTPRDYQLAAFIKAIRDPRRVFLCPTASGKSLIIYLISSYYADKKKLIIVPTIGLVQQLASDFNEYSMDKTRFQIHQIKGGEYKETTKPIVISTWQSIYKQPVSWFKQFDIIIGDEVHLFSAKSLAGIMQKGVDVAIRYGFTGTLDGSVANELVIQGLFGPVTKVISTAKLIEQKHLSTIDVKCILLNHPKTDKQAMYRASYMDERDFIVTNQKRNEFIAKLAVSLEGNTIVFFREIEKQGDRLKLLIESLKSEDQTLYYIKGDVVAEEREDIRKAIDKKSNCILLASEGTSSTGINIRSLNNMIYAAPSKSRIKVFQTIGRLLRRTDTKHNTILYDIADDLSTGTFKNHTLSHYDSRLLMYNEEKFPFKQYSVRLE